MPGIDRKWRPSLAQVLGGALLGTLGLSFIGLVVLRLIGPAIGYRWGVVLVGGVMALGGCGSIGGGSPRLVSAGSTA